MTNTSNCVLQDEKTRPAPRYFLGIDGGGTKTAFALADERGSILSRVTLGACNPNDVGFEQTERILHEGIISVCEGYPMEEISAFAGLAGCSSVENLPRISAVLTRFGFGRTANDNDAKNAVAAALGTKDGVAVIMGTGSIAYAQKGSALYRIGGYGYLFGDKGSGFSIGKDVILSALQQEDGSGQSTALYDLVRNACGGDTVLSKIDFFYREGKKEIARYAPLAFQAYRQGDDVAKRIVEDNMQAIAALILGGAKNLGETPLKAVLCGGVTKAQDVVLPILSKMLAESGCEARLCVCEKEPVWGALILAGMPCGHEEKE